MITLYRVRFVLVALAVCLCLVEAVFHSFELLAFTDPESARGWTVVLLSTAFWLPAVTSIRYPVSSLIILALLLVTEFVLCTGSGMALRLAGEASLSQCLGEIQLSLSALALLLVNAILERVARTSRHR